MVFAVDPYSLRAIVTGRYNESKSPERRNARPFVNLLAVQPPVRRRTAARAGAPGDRQVSRIWLPRRRHLAEGIGVDRRAFLAAGLRAGGGALAALALAGCNSKGPRGAQGTLRAAERWNERVERRLFRPTARNVPSTRAPAAGLKFPSYFVSAEMPVWDEAQRGVWRLEVSGLVDGRCGSRSTS